MQQHTELAIEEMLFRENIREFSARVANLSGLEQGGKLSPEACYRELRVLYARLVESHDSLGLDADETDGPV